MDTDLLIAALILGPIVSGLHKMGKITWEEYVNFIYSLWDIV